MIQQIQIENFRCFDQLQAEGFGRVNLITGLNNTGKTALLEAIYALLDVNNFAKKINIRESSENNEDVVLSLIKDRKIENTAKISTESTKLTITTQKINLNYADVYTASFDSETGRGGTSKKTEHTTPYENHRVSLIFDKKNQYPHLVNLAAALDNAELRGQKHLIINAIRTIDTSIDDLRTFASKPNILFLQRAGKYIPIDYFGDAVQKMIRYLCTILEWSDTPNAIKYLLIDEIENGLHYTVQAEFWRYLFTFALQFDVQIFATCHSLEMLQAFAKVADSEAFRDDAVYIEMARHFKTKQIVALPRKIELLNFGLANGSKMRGEI